MSCHRPDSDPGRPFASFRPGFETIAGDRPRDPWHLLLRGFLVLLVALALLVPSAGMADDDDDDDDEETAVIVFDEDWRPQTALVPGGGLDNLFEAMGRLPGSGSGPDTPCDDTILTPLLAQPAPAPDSWACLRLENSADQPGVWRVDFEDTFGAGYRLVTVQAGVQTTIFYHPGVATTAADPALTAGRRLASRPILLAPGETIDLYAQITSPSDLDDADPVLLPEEQFDQRLLQRNHAFALYAGASALMVVFFLAFARLLQSTPAQRYAVYFGAATLAALSNEGFLNLLAPGNPALIVGSLDKLFEATQVTAHFLFMAAFLRDGVPGSRHEIPLRRLGWAAGVGLIAAALGSLALEGTEGALRYHDLGFELDPLFEDPFDAPINTFAALITACWYTALLAVAVHVVRRRADGGRLFAAGAVTLVSGMLFASFGEDLTDLVGDDHLLPQYVLLADAVLFAAAMVWQVFGIRDQRDAALQHELEATREKMRLAENLLQSRRDLDRTRALAESHRERLALTGHDLRQPLTSLQLALSELDTSNPELGQTLRSNVEYLRSVLNHMVADTRPDAPSDGGSEPARSTPEAEAVPVDVLLSNAVRMFREEAQDKGLTLTAEPSGLEVRTVPIALIRILSNLVSNAVKYTVEGSVTLRAAQVGETVTLEVVDTGPGLTPDEITAIREEYQRGSTAGEIAGDGLGLPSAEKLALSIGLALNVRSEVGTGSVFSVTALERG